MDDDHHTYPSKNEKGHLPTCNLKHPVVSTYKILKQKALNADVDESWIDWAIEMMEAGYESNNLFELAGTTRPYNQFHLQELTTYVLNDLQLDYTDKGTVINEYIYFLITASLNKPENYFTVLKEIKDIYTQFDVSECQDFALLCWAKEDLLIETYQHYWEGANRENIDTIITEQFELFIKNFDTINNIQNK